MKIKTSELTDAALNYAVAVAKGYGHFDAGEPCEKAGFFSLNGHSDCLFLTDFRPSSLWSQGGPIIEDEQILVGPSPFPTGSDRKFAAGLGCDWDTCTFVATGPTPLVAAMRCYVLSRLGSEVDIPEELLS